MIVSRIAVAALIALTLLQGLTLLSVRDEIALGREAQRQVRSKVPEMTDPAAVRYIRALGRTLSAHTTGPAYPYSFSIADYKEINAFALPGGPVWIHRGAIQASATESQLAGVLAHEIAHIARRHAASQVSKRLVTNGLLGLLGAMLGNNGGARAAQAGAQLMAEGYMLRFSRDDEREADAVGVEIMRRAGWDPQGMIAFLETLRRLDARDAGSVAVFLSSHPATDERVQRLREQVRGMRRGGRRDSAEFTRVHARLRRMPAAHAMTRNPD
jgi:predicted Zn-dependent protease